MSGESGALLTDLYQLTMLQAYVRRGMGESAVFELFVRSLPPARLETLRAAVRDGTAALAERIRRGEADAGPFRAAVRAHVRAAVEDKLRVANPRFLASAGGATR